MNRIADDFLTRSREFRFTKLKSNSVICGFFMGNVTPVNNFYAEKFQNHFELRADLGHVFIVPPLSSGFQARQLYEDYYTLPQKEIVAAVFSMSEHEQCHVGNTSLRIEEFLCQLRNKMISYSLKEIDPRINMFANSFLKLNFADPIGYACVVKETVQFLRPQKTDGTRWNYWHQFKRS